MLRDSLFGSVLDDTSMGIHESRKWYSTVDAARRLTDVLGRFVPLDDVWNLIADQVLPLYFRPIYRPVLVLKVVPACAWPLSLGGPGRGVPAASQFVAGEEPATFKFQMFKVWSIDPFRPQVLARMGPKQIDASFKALVKDSGLVWSRDWKLSTPAGTILEDEATGDLLQLLELGAREEREGHRIQYCQATTIAWDDLSLVVSAEDLAAIETSGGAKRRGMDASRPDSAVQRPLSKQAAQEAAILAEIERQGVQPRALPKPPVGKSGVKAAVRDVVTKEKGLFQSRKVFDLAWERLRGSGCICDEEAANPPPLS